MINWITILKEKEILRAELIKIELEKYGIETVLLNKVDHNYPVLGIIEIKVPLEKSEEAKLIIQDFNAND